MSKKKQILIDSLKAIKHKQMTNSTGGDFDDHHIEADQLLLDYINDREVTEKFHDIEKWYA